MDVGYTPEQEELRIKVRSWLQENLPLSGLKTERLDPSEKDAAWLGKAKAWHRKLYDAGFLGLAWPKEYGGQALDPVSQSIINEEMQLAHAPGPLGSAIQQFGPTLIAFGTDEQKEKYLPKALAGEQVWCQGYSEPGSGSDLASLRTRAELTGDEFVVNGSKIWTSGAHYSDMMYCLVRSDPQAPKHRGISYIMIDMKTPGIEARRLTQISGESDFNQVFFDNVRVPRENLVGKLNEGWLVANATLFHERNGLGSYSTSWQFFDRLLKLAQSIKRNGQPLSKDPLVRQQLASLEIRVESMKYHYYRQLTDNVRGRNPGVEAMINKYLGTELNFDLGAAAMDLMGDYSMLPREEDRALDKGYWPYIWMLWLGLTIGGGTNFIQKNIIAERGLRMPKQARI